VRGRSKDGGALFVCVAKVIDVKTTVPERLL
jgi:hypothetical protein